MWILVILAHIITVVHSQQQNTRRPEPHDNGHGWDIRLAVPGEPGGDYPTLNTIPKTSFSCSRKSPGYYADVETGCQVFRVCTLGSTYGFQSFLCPNGTLFNQEVFVCDWWMNVNCKISQQLLNNNREKFGNLKLGPQLMKDIKKMLTHPMRNPYDKAIMKSNLIVMQEYKPPSGQLFPNGALISGPERPPSNIYVPAKQRLGNFAQNSFFSGDLTFAASTPSSKYIPSSFNAVESIPNRNLEILQQQRQNNPSLHISNSPTGAIRAKTSNLNNNERIQQSPYPAQRNIQQSPQQNPLTGPFQRQVKQYTNKINSHNEIRLPDKITMPIPTQQYNYISKQNEQLNENKHPQLNKQLEAPKSRDPQQYFINFNNPQPTGKTLKFSRIVQKSSSGNPKSRITFKTWIVRTPKTAQIVADPTPYTYDKPTLHSASNKLVDTSEDDNNNTPTTEKVNSESEDIPYVYNKPIQSSKQVSVVEEIPHLYLPPTEPTFSNQPYSTMKISQFSNNLNLPPTTYKPASRFYIVPSESSYELSRQYLSPNERPETINYQSDRLVATPTSPAVEFSTTISNNQKTPSFSLTKQSYINTNHNNLTFADILTKEKLDITVNDIVKNTNEILKTASPSTLNQYRDVAENFVNDYLSPELNNELEEKSSLQQLRTTHRSEKLIATPSTELEPPMVTSNNNHKSTNKLINLPFFKEPVPTNTIERTVSLKISIPETIAEFLFNNHSQSNSDNLEILNTGSSNYLVLTQSHLNENTAGLIPIGKLIWDKNINISNSQALVYSFLADSINTAKEYNNLAKQSIISSTSATIPQITNRHNEDIQDITNKVSLLTSSHYAKENRNKGDSDNKDNFKPKTELSKEQSIRSDLSYSQFSQQILPNEPYSSRLQLSRHNIIENPDNQSEIIYSGQLYKLPVPLVTSQIYNAPNILQSPQGRQANDLSTGSQSLVNQAITLKSQSNRDVETIPFETMPYPPIRQLLPRTDESAFNTGNIFSKNILNTDSGITAQLQDKITGTLPHPLEENKLVTYEKNKSYYLYTKLEEDNNENIQETNKITQKHERSNIQNSNLIRHGDLSNTLELFPAIRYELEDERDKQKTFNAFKINDFSDVRDNFINKPTKTERINQIEDLVTGVDFTILHPTTKKHVENNNNVLYRGPSSYLAPQSSVGSLGGNQQLKSHDRIEKFEDINGYSEPIPAIKFSFK